GTPTDLYSNPESPFIADFVGTSNIFNGKVVGRENNLTSIQFGDHFVDSVVETDKEDVQVIIRPESFQVIDNGETVDNYFEGIVQFATYLGSTVRYDIKVGEYSVVADTVYESGDSIIRNGTKVKLK